MSTSMNQQLEHDNGTPSGMSQPSPPEHALKLSKEPSSSDIQNYNSILSVQRQLTSQPSSAAPHLPNTTNRPKPRLPTENRSSSHESSSTTSRVPSPSSSLQNDNQECTRIILASFAPRVAVYSSADTEEFARHKGFKDGLCSLLRSYGERLQGKVIIRDSNGVSRGWDDFGIRFVDGNNPSGIGGASEANHDHSIERLPNGFSQQPQNAESQMNVDHGTTFNQSFDHYLYMQEKVSDNLDEDDPPFRSSSDPRRKSSALYMLYLRKLLSGKALVPHETFSHPVTCMITVSSHHPAPIEALRQLYTKTIQGQNSSIPVWVNTDYLRYYVLVHDEEQDDITKSTALFDLMKRHFGLHCHLLRLRSSHCIQTDDDSTQVPQCEWLSFEEERRQTHSRDCTDDFEVPEKYIMESDVTAIRALLREMVAQSIVPFMENRMMTWNDQVASRRRGISGRFMSLSKRWAGFGSSRNASSGSNGVQNPSNGNYDYQRGAYLPDTPEATMRHLADYAFMLRDWKLAHNTYDFLRTDFSHDKAWSYHAAANEMAAISSLLSSQFSSSRFRSEHLDQMLDTAAYSYLTRCSMPSAVVRCLTMAMELLKGRGLVAVDEAAKWGGKLLELGVLGQAAQALTAERIAEAYMARTDSEAPSTCTRRRQAAFWHVLSSDSWIGLGKLSRARVRLQKARALYQLGQPGYEDLPFPSMQGLWQHLEHALRDTNSDGDHALIDVGSHQSLNDLIELEEAEQLNAFTPFSSARTESSSTQDPDRLNAYFAKDVHSKADGFE